MRISGLYFERPLPKNHPQQIAAIFKVDLPSAQLQRAIGAFVGGRLQGNRREPIRLDPPVF